MLVALMGAGAMALASAAPAFAAGPPNPPTLGAPNCHGQIIATNNNGDPHLSIGQYSQLSGHSVQAIQERVRALCSA